MRVRLIVLHRWAGLITAVFLFVCGVTGAVISWDHEIDEWLNSHLFVASSEGTPKDAIALAAQIEKRDPHARVIHMFMTPETGHSLSFFIQPRVDPATGKRHLLDYNQVFLDAATGNELGRRYWGAVWPLTRETFVSFLYKLHYTLHIPEFWGSNRWGVRFLGIIAIIWTIDSFVGFVLTLPLQRKQTGARLAAVDQRLRRGFWARWRPAWTIKTAGSAYRINFDIHRAFSLWTWGLLVVIAFTAFSLNLNREVFTPIMRTVSSYTPSPFEQRTPAPPDRPIEPVWSYPDILKKAEADGRARGWQEPVGVLFYSPQHGIYSASFFKPGDDHGVGGVGPPRLYYDAMDGRSLGERLPWRGTAADLFAQAQFPVHSGRILGLPGRILISLMGVIVAALSVTGVVIWWRKRHARTAAQAVRRARPIGGRLAASDRPAE